MKPSTIKQFIHSAVDLGISDLVDLIRTGAKTPKERKELLHYLHNYVDRAANPTVGLKNTVRRAKRRG